MLAPFYPYWGACEPLLNRWPQCDIFGRELRRLVLVHEIRARREELTCGYSGWLKVLSALYSSVVKFQGETDPPFRGGKEWGAEFEMIQWCWVTFNGQHP